MKKPDNVMLERWLDGKLDGESLRQVEAWAEAYPEELSRELGLDQVSQQVSHALPAAIEPPYPEFFNHKIQQAIEDERAAEASAAVHRPSWFQRFSWILAPSAVAAMALCFYMGTLTVQPQMIEPTVVQETAIPTEIYLPQSGVSAEVSYEGDSTIIILDGLKEIPDDIDIRSSAAVEPKKSKFMVSHEDRDMY